MTRDGQNKSLWQQSLQEQVDNQQVSLPVDIVFDVVIVGGGITGISTGLELQNAGKKVLIAEAYNIGFGTTGGTTAHLNSFLDTSYADIRKKFSVPDAKSVANAIAESLALIQTNITKYGIDCDYKQLPAYLFSRNQQQSKDLDEILIASREAGIEAAYANDLPVNMEYEKIVSFANQAQFHPLRYLHGLASAFINAGGIIAENCRITGVDEHKLLTITSTRGTLSARYLIYATHIPPGVNLLHFRCAPYRSYALSIQLSNENDYPML
jgi:glycine/D-amino acid oxidase-like deaminating enzyme